MNGAPEGLFLLGHISHYNPRILRKLLEKSYSFLVSTNLLVAEKCETVPRERYKDKNKF
jgi:hypothetical protein